MTQKELAREKLQGLFTNTEKENWSGRACEQLRNIPAYCRASTLFISPSTPAKQACLNGLNDRKHIILPSPGFKAGFLLLKPDAIPFQKRSFAVSSRGVLQFGKKISTDDLAKLSIEIAVTGALAVDRSGNRLGDGHGFFDLAIAMLAETGALAEKYLCAAIVRQEQIVDTPLPCSPWDIPLDVLAHPEGTIFINKEPVQPRVHWQQLETRRIRKASPLWDLYCRKNI